MKIPVFNLGALDTTSNPLAGEVGRIIKSVNVDNFPFGAKRRRPGYILQRSSPAGDGTSGVELLNWTRNNGTQFWNYSSGGGLGGVLSYSSQGTSAWANVGNGTFSTAGTIVHAVLEDTLVLSDKVGTILTTTNGTSLTPAVASPPTVALAEYKQRIYAAGTASNLFWSNIGTPTDWINDSSSILIPGPGKLHSLFTQGDKLVITKNSGAMFTWDNFNLRDISTNLGPSSASSVASIEDYPIWLNRQGFYGFNGDRPELLSSSIENIIYNSLGSGIVGTIFDDAHAVVHQNKYYCNIGSASEDLSNEPIGIPTPATLGTETYNVAVYDFRFKDWSINSYDDNPYTFLSYKNEIGDQRFIFSEKLSQDTYAFIGTANEDAGIQIQSVVEYVAHLGNLQEKRWNYLWCYFNPGGNAVVEAVLSNTFNPAPRDWVTLGAAKEGVLEYKFPAGSRSRLLFLRVRSRGKGSSFTWYGFEIDVDIIDRR